ncbi:hypothetical protein AX17_000038 [Amanita inopinata Kibby_2008]|nr:hypothetical protein AX17_000038 [Amanita inopinata Kibby_2008]
MVSKRLYDGLGARYWDQPSDTELIFVVLNYVACVPVLLLVGGFSLYHFYLLLGNSTTIEGWEKDKVATMIRRGEIREVKFPYNLGARRNIESVLGHKSWLWCFPTSTPGTGLRFELAEGDDVEQWWPPQDPDRIEHEFNLPESPWTYDNDSLNPDLQPSNSQSRQSSTVKRRRPKQPGVSSVPPYHSDYKPEAIVAVDDDDSSSFSEDNVAPHVRRGSEGYEVRSIGREELLHRYLEELGEKPGRYVRYTPHPESNSESESGDMPLMQDSGSIHTNA